MISKTVAEYITRHRLIASGDLVVAGVSGGPDSVALLHVLLRLRKPLGFQVRAAHLHHGLRAEADEDQKLVEDICREWQVPLSLRRVDVARMALEEKVSVEEAGREARYRFMEQLRSEIGGDKIATAHHRSDQAETVLLHLIQGTGARGLQGMLPRRGNIIRPFLELTRPEIMAYLDDNGLPYRIDSSNFDNNYLRNRIRWELLPLLEKRFNPSMVDVLCRLAEVMKEENLYWDDLIKGLEDDLATGGEETSLAAGVDAIRRMPVALRRRFLHHLLRRAGVRRVTWDDVERVLDLSSREGSNLRVPVTGGKWVRKSYETLEFGAEELTDTGFCYHLDIPGDMMIPEIGIRVTARLWSERPSLTAGAAVFDWERLKKPLYIRSRRQGDSFRPLGLNGGQKIKKYLIDKKIPFDQRNKIGIMAADDEIYWVIGHRQDERGKVSEDTSQFLEVAVSNVEK